MNAQERAELAAWVKEEQTVIEPRIEARLRDGIRNTVADECPCDRGYANCYGGEFGPCPVCACPACKGGGGA